MRPPPNIPKIGVVQRDLVSAILPTVIGATRRSVFRCATLLCSLVIPQLLLCTAVSASTSVDLHPVTFFQTYDLYIIAVIALCVGEAVLIAWLLELRSRRRQAEEGKARIESLAKAEHQRMDEVVSNMPGVVWEVRIDPLTQKRKTTFVSLYVETMMGYTVDEWLASPGMGLRIDRKSVV